MKFFFGLKLEDLFLDMHLARYLPRYGTEPEVGRTAGGVDDRGCLCSLLVHVESVSVVVATMAAACLLALLLSSATGAVHGLPQATPTTVRLNNGVVMPQVLLGMGLWCTLTSLLPAG